MSGKEKIRELFNQGLSPKEIAEETGYSINTIHTYKTMFNKEAENGKPKATVMIKQPQVSAEKATVESDNPDKERYKKLIKAYNILEKKYLDTKEVNGQISDELNKIKGNHNKLKEDYAKISETVSDDLSTNNTEIKALINKVKYLSAENKKLKTRNDELIDEARNEIEGFEKRYETEKSKHELLFQYLVTAKEVV